MQPSIQRDLIDRIFTVLDKGSSPVPIKESRVELEKNYRDKERFQREKDRLFRLFPLVLAHRSELSQPGDCVTHDASGLPLVLVCDKSLKIRAFLNVCRHRGARLVTKSCQEQKALTCRYHAWSYALDGKILHIPLEKTFEGTDKEELRLVELPVLSRYGFIWVLPQKQPSNQKTDPLLQDVGEDLEHFSISTYQVFRKKTAIRKTHWKLVIEAFLEGYHVASLHRDTLSKFFINGCTLFDVFGSHIRSFAPRRNIQQAKEIPREQWKILDFATVFYFIFPNTVLVFHPDSVSHLALFPLAIDSCYYIHTFLTPKKPETQKEIQHWEKTYALIEETVFQKEDLMITESIQQGIFSEANEYFTLGSMEYPIRIFHDSIDKALADKP